MCVPVYTPVLVGGQAGMVDTRSGQVGRSRITHSPAEPSRQPARQAVQEQSHGKQLPHLLDGIPVLLCGVPVVLDFEPVDEAGVAVRRVLDPIFLFHTHAERAPSAHTRARSK